MMDIVKQDSHWHVRLPEATSRALTRVRVYYATPLVVGLDNGVDSYRLNIDYGKFVRL